METSIFSVLSKIGIFQKRPAEFFFKNETELVKIAVQIVYLQVLANHLQYQVTLSH